MDIQKIDWELAESSRNLLVLVRENKRKAARLVIFDAAVSAWDFFIALWDFHCGRPVFGVILLCAWLVLSYFALKTLRLWRELRCHERILLYMLDLAEKGENEYARKY